MRQTSTPKDDGDDSSTGPIPLNSSWMRSAEYDSDNKQLTITLDNGNEYTYRSVPVQVFSALIAAPSAGHYYRANIKGRFSEA